LVASAATTTEEVAESAAEDVSELFEDVIDV
jgi:hypothetical protein